tara:strand:+ start:8266 stop:9426 length:1161 start_codon:yes stop_codon:yes gene_type:complete
MNLIFKEIRDLEEQISAVETLWKSPVTKARGLFIERRRKQISILGSLDQIRICKRFFRHLRLYFLGVDLQSQFSSERSLGQIVGNSSRLEFFIFQVKKYIRSIQQRGEKYSGHVIYAERLVDILLFSRKVITNKTEVNYVRHQLSYCCLCFKQPEDSLFYCEEHSSKHNTNEYNKAKRRLIFALKSEKPQLYQEFINEREAYKGRQPELFFKYTASFAAKTALMDIELVNNEVTLENLLNEKSNFLDICKKHYPRTFEKISFIKSKEFASSHVLVLEIVKALDPMEAFQWEAIDVDIWIQTTLINGHLDVLTHYIARHEAYCNITALYSREKSFKFSRENRGLKDDIKRLMQDQIDKNGKVNKAEIARQLDISRQRVSYLTKTFSL